MTCGTCKHEAVRNGNPCSGCSHGRWWEPKDQPETPLEAMTRGERQRLEFLMQAVRSFARGAKGQE